jgi:hypothetical protein
LFVSNGGLHIPVRDYTHDYTILIFVNLGVLVSVDQYMNVQLGNAIEYIDEQNKGPLGEILIRCNNILYISGIEETDEDDDAMAQ